MTETAIITVSLQDIEYTLQVIIPVKRRGISEKELGRRAINIFHTATIVGCEIQKRKGEKI